MINDPVDHYHSLLTGSLADDALWRLDSGMRRWGLNFGGRPVCNVLRPFFVSEQRYAEVTRRSAIVLSAIHKLYELMMKDARVRREAGVTSDEEKLIQIEPGYSAPDASGRLDAFFDSNGGFGIVEYNPDSPGGLLYGDVLGEIFSGMAVIREFEKSFRLRRVPVRPRILETLLACYREWGWSDHPNIAIVDWKEAKTRAEFEVSREYFESRGFPTRVLDPDDLEYRGGWLSSGDFRIHLVYKRVLTGELLKRCGLEHALIRAAADRAVCVINSFRVQLMFRKSLFAMLQDPAFENLFTTDEIRAVKMHVPWTRRLREGHTTYRGRKVDLLDFVVKERERLVLKPNSEYGGRGVFLGWEASDEEWQVVLKSAIESDFVVQERVEVPDEEFPSLRRGEIRLLRRYVDFDPYAWRGESVEGAGVRLSTSPVLNVTSGGGSAAPIFLLSNGGGA
jgi:hypothetical protein